MAQRKQLTWMELRVGLFVLVGLCGFGRRHFLRDRRGNRLDRNTGSSPIFRTFRAWCTELRCD